MMTTVLLPRRMKACHVAEKERAKAEKEKAALVREIFTDIEILLRRNAEKIYLRTALANCTSIKTLEEDIIDLEMKYKKRCRGKT